MTDRHAGVGPPVAIYVHIPFCVSVCPYCDFVVVAGAAARGPAARIWAFVDALVAEIDLRADDLDRRWPGHEALDSVYLGGGTPSLLPADEIARILARIGERFGIAAGAEVTLEVNPGPDERGDPAAQRRAGITRLSVGAQSLEAGELRQLGRRHAPKDVAEAVAAAREAGIASVSLDLLYDIPDVTVAAWMSTLDAALDLAPDHLSLYALTLDDPDAEGLTGPLGDHLPTSAGARRWRDAARPHQDEDRAVAQYHHAVVTLGAAGFRGYEISNWALPGHESRHNMAYWTRRPHEAVGPGAHAFDGVTRRWNAARLDGYVAALAGGGLPPGADETTDPATAAAESVILALRLDTGVPAAAAHEPPLAEHFGWALAAGLLEVSDQERVVLTTRGRLLSNELFSRLV
ncbi:MAG: coproporphyrinogen-III oxidase family protein [Chloroflexota bacterium]